MSNNLTIEKFKHVLYSCYNKDTGYKSTEILWDITNRSIGQCTVATLLVRDYFGGYIKKGYVKKRSMYHYWNEINGRKIDFTIEQIGNRPIINIEKIKTKSKNSLLKIISVSKRYEILKRRVQKRIQEWQVLEKQISLCEKCSVETHFKHNSVHFGLNCDLLFIGEAPAKNGWRVTGRAWYNPKDKLIPSGKIFTKLLDIVEIDLRDATFLEAIKCFPIKGTIKKEHVENCKPILFKQITLLKPLIIIPMGVRATELILDEKVVFSESVGKFTDITINEETFKIYPMYHPSPASPKSLKANIPVFENLKRYLSNIDREKRAIKF